MEVMNYFILIKIILEHIVNEENQIITNYGCNLIYWKCEIKVLSIDNPHIPLMISSVSVTSDPHRMTRSCPVILKLQSYSSSFQVASSSYDPNTRIRG